MKLSIFAASSAVMVLGIISSANATPDLAKAKNCLMCHKIDAKLMGPGFNDVAKKYSGDKDAEAKIVKQIRQGGGGQWGSIPMPAQPQVSDEEAKQLAQWILTLK